MNPGEEDRLGYLGALFHPTFGANDRA
jgi:hypothetical protein